MSLQAPQTEAASKVDPISTLPTEIACEIFIHCLPYDTEDVFDPSEAPLLLTHVSMAWRELVIAMPLLWTAFNVEFELHGPDLPDMAKEWLQRSQECLLSVRFSGPLSDVEDLEGFMQIFGQHSARVRSLDLELDEDTAAELDGFFLQFTALEELDIFFDGEQQDLDEAISTFQYAPLLRKVDIFELSLDSVKLPLQQLTQFTRNEIPVFDLLDALRQMPQLTRGGFELSEDDEDDEPLQPLRHSSLQHLTIAAASPLQHPYWLELLTLPFLHTLILHNFDDLDEDLFLSFLRRSSAPLRKLSFYGIIMLKMPSQRVFETLKQLTELLFASASTEGVSAFFEAFGADASLLPCLERLTFICGDSEDYDHADVTYVIDKAVAGINKRRNLISEPEQQLRSLRILGANEYDEVPFKLPEELPLPLLKLKESGMDIRLGMDDGLEE